MADTVFYDGHCGFCHRLVRFLLAVDSEGVFRFAPLNGATFARTISGEVRASLPDSIVVRKDDGTLLVRWASIQYILERTGGAWRLVGRAFDILPRRFLDWCYDRAARFRKHLFRAPEDDCPLVPPHLRSRFDL